MTDLRGPDVGARLDRLPPTRYIWYLVGLVSFGAFFEIYDLVLTAPLSLGLLVAGVFHRGAEGLFGITDQATFAAATFAGLYLGTLGFSAVADRLGRRPVFTFALLWYATATVVMGLQNSAIAIDLCRFVASMGVGLELVAIDCYLAELMPKTVRGRAFAVSASLQFLSVPLVSVLAWLLIPGTHLGIDGWRWLAFVPAVGALLVWQVRRALPESPRWLEAHGRAAEAHQVTSSIEQRVARDLGYQVPEVLAPADAPMRGPAKTTSLWRPPYRRRTIVLIVFHLFQTIGYFGFANWLPTLLVAQGIEIGKSLAYSAVLALVPPIAPLAFSLFVDKVERKWMVAAGALLAAIAGLLLSRITQHSDFAMFTVIGAGVAIGNSLMSLSYHTYQSELFPTPMRARAVGFVYSFSRLSAIFTSYLIAATLDRAGSVGVFVLISMAMVVVALTVGLFGPRTRGLALEHI
ncbi:MAG TPA: MFS transporter [Steroidobacteraceae bacterium]|nr:MFS transporter [Steroidobacteraceae bacterium]